MTILMFTTGLLAGAGIGAVVRALNTWHWPVRTPHKAFSLAIKTA